MSTRVLKSSVVSSLIVGMMLADRIVMGSPDQGPDDIPMQVLTMLAEIQVSYTSALDSHSEPSHYRSHLFHVETNCRRKQRVIPSKSAILDFCLMCQDDSPRRAGECLLCDDSLTRSWYVFCA